MLRSRAVALKQSWASGNFMSLCWACRKLPTRLFSPASAAFGGGVKRGFPGLGPRFMRGALFVAGFRSPVLARSV